MLPMLLEPKALAVEGVLGIVYFLLRALKRGYWLPAWICPHVLKVRCNRTEQCLACGSTRVDCHGTGPWRSPRWGGL